MPASLLCLSDLSPSDSARITGYDASCPMAYRRILMSRGILPNSVVSAVRVAPLGDPIEFLVREYRLTLRRNEAKFIRVERL